MGYELRITTHAQQVNMYSLQLTLLFILLQYMPKL